MMLEPGTSGPVFVFDSTNDLLVCPSVDYACRWVEAVDVADGEYTAFLHDGTEVRLTAVTRTEVVAEVSDTRDREALLSRIAEYEMAIARSAGRPVGAAVTDPLRYAERELREQWENRWPKRPRWLDRRLHGDGPPPVGPDAL